MATSESLLLKNLSGAIGKELVIRQYGDKTVVSKYPDMSKRKLSAKQIQVNEMMAEANYEARRTIGDDKLRQEAQVRLNVTRNRLYNALVREYFQLQRAKDTGIR